MKTAHQIPLERLALAFIPATIVICILFVWSANGRGALYAMARMIIQLLLIGYALTLIFAADNPLIITGILSTMLAAAAWIALRPMGKERPAIYVKALAAIAAGGVPTLLIITAGVLSAKKWYQPDLVIPLAGMIFANAMNTVSLAGERYKAESERGLGYAEARNIALSASLIPTVNSLFAVGIVSLPGMMTGQIISGVDPLIAVRYQVMVMAMIFGASGIASACFLLLLRTQPQGA